MISQGASEINISCVIEQDKSFIALTAIHQKMIENIHWNLYIISNFKLSLFLIKMLKFIKYIMTVYYFKILKII